MIKKYLVFIIFFAGNMNAVRSQADFSKRSYPMQIIFDTDFGPDYDDVGAIALLHCFADSGYIHILATMASSCHRNAAAAISVFNTYFNRPDLPVGIVRGDGVSLGDGQHWTDTVIARYPHKIQNNREAADAPMLYRKILSSKPDHSVTIITVGFLTNLSDLLETHGDQFSSLSGLELVKKKVSNLVCMAGKFPSGREFNLDQDVNSSKKVLAAWPTPILFSGFEIGQKIKTGLPIIHNDAIHQSPVKDVFAICIPQAKEDSAGRMSWDETAVLVAIKGWQGYYDIQKGRCKINANGFNEWNKTGNMQAHLKERESPYLIAALINQLMMHQPSAVRQ